MERGKHVDIVLMDIKMPVYDGHEVTRILKEKYPEIPIIAQTAFASKDERDACLRDGANGFLSKPYGPEELRRAVSELL